MTPTLRVTDNRRRSMNIRTWIHGSLLTLLIIAPSTALAQTGTSVSAQPGTSAPRDAKMDGRAEYQIGPEDVLDIAVWNNTSLSRTTPVRPDGKISLPLLNDIQAAGLTPMQLRE